MSTVKFTATKLPVGKKGIIKPDETGAYTMPIGGLNAFNSMGQYYTLQGAKKLFEDSSIFMRRVANGCLKGEVGHPKRQPGMSLDDYMSRILTVEETNTCCHFTEIWLDEGYGKNNPEHNNPNLVAIMAKIRPSGPKGDFLRQAFESEGENVCFSIRSLTRDYYLKGVTNREIQTIVTFDFVTEPGISIANKFKSPALESLVEVPVMMTNLERVIERQPESLAMESTRSIAIECMNTAFADKMQKDKPLYTKW